MSSSEKEVRDLLSKWIPQAIYNVQEFLTVENRTTLVSKAMLNAGVKQSLYLQLTGMEDEDSSHEWRQTLNLPVIIVNLNWKRSGNDFLLYGRISALGFEVTLKESLWDYEEKGTIENNLEFEKSFVFGVANANN